MLLEIVPCCSSPEWQTAIATWTLVLFTFLAAGAASYAAFYAYRTFRLENDGNIVITTAENQMPELFEGALEIQPEFSEGEERHVAGIVAMRPNAHWVTKARDGISNWPMVWLSMSNP